MLGLYIVVLATLAIQTLHFISDGQLCGICWYDTNILYVATPICISNQEKHNMCGCLDIPQNTCSLSCFNSGLQEIKDHLNETKLLSRFSIMRTACKVRDFVVDVSCAKSCETSSFGNWYSFLEELHSAFQQIAGEAESK
ncbi:interleukin 9 isoform 1 precursor [Xenopus tropicalis]|uniref:Interleukin 9 isoform 1 precursor n=1 Tax=Xenopus tropicalis TaxID=8364 RepID=Q38JW2_XENTR|nr:interleukin 9 isoform 1 precursor [Xenopus tropicalis]ABB02614.1 interleukin-9 [Xenopus tropicalis]|eukprot:NP_001165366.1 interleukin 9 isoform 1 precursor [Xenopus tropicalis]